MEPSVETSQQRSASRRVLMGVVGLGMFGVGALVLTRSIVGLAGCVGSECPRWGGLLIFFGLPLTVAGVPLALATFVPFGKFRGGIVGLGVGLLAGVSFFLLGAVMIGTFALGAILGVGAAAAVFYLGYRTER